MALGRTTILIFRDKSITSYWLCEYMEPLWLIDSIHPLFIDNLIFNSHNTTLWLDPGTPQAGLEFSLILFKQLLIIKLFSGKKKKLGLFIYDAKYKWTQTRWVEVDNKDTQNSKHVCWLTFIVEGNILPDRYRHHTCCLSLFLTKVIYKEKFVGVLISLECIRSDGMDSLKNLSTSGCTNIFNKNHIKVFSALSSLGGK